MTRIALLLVLAFAIAPAPCFGQALAKLPALESDPLPTGAERRLGTNRLRLPTRVGYFMFSPDDSTLMVGSGSNVHFWDTKTWRETWQLSAVAFTCSPDGKHVARRTDEFTIEVWDMQKKALVHTRNLGRFGRGSRIFDLEFNPKGDLLWLGVSRNGVWLYDWAADKIEKRIDIPDVMETSLTHSGDRKAFALQKQSGPFAIYDGVTGKLIREVNVNLKSKDNSPPEWHALSYDGKILATGNSQPTYAFWDVATGKEAPLLPELAKPKPMPKAEDEDMSDDLVYDRSRFGSRALFDSKGAYIVIGGAQVRTVDLSKKAVVAKATLQGTFPMAYAISHDNKTLAIGFDDGSVELRYPATLEPLLHDPHPRGPALGVAFTRDGQTLATFNGNKTAVRLWNPREGSLLRSFDVDYERLRSLPPLSFADNDRRVVLGAAGAWKTATGDPLPPIVRKDRALTTTANGSRWLFSKENDQAEVTEITLEDLVAGRELAKLPLELGPDTTIVNYYLRSALSDDGALAALHRRLSNRRDPNTGEMRTLEDSIVVWNVQGAKPVPVFSTPCRKVPRAIELSPSGQFLALQGEATPDHPHQLWHLPTGFALWKATSDPTPKGAPRRPVFTDGDDFIDVDGLPLVAGFEAVDFGAMAFSPDGKFVAIAAPGGIVVRETISGAPLLTFTGQAGRVASLAFSPDGRQLASAAGDSTVMLWTVPPFAAAKPGSWKRDNFDNLWSNLKAGGNLAYQSMVELHAGGDEAVALLKDKIQPETEEERRLVVQALGDLASPKFPVREKASAQLEKWGFRLKPYLAAAIAQSNDLEQKRRLLSILDRCKSNGIDPEELRLSRAAYLLEAIGTPGARVILENLARGHASDLTAQTARGALARLQRAQK